MIWQKKKVYEETFWNKTKSARLSADNKGFHSYIFFLQLLFLSILQVSTSGEQERTAKAKHGIGLTHKPRALFIQFLRVKKSRKGIISFPLNLTQANETCIYLQE